LNSFSKWKSKEDLDEVVAEMASSAHFMNDRYLESLTSRRLEQNKCKDIL